MADELQSMLPELAVACLHRNLPSAEKTQVLRGLRGLPGQARSKGSRPHGMDEEADDRLESSSSVDTYTRTRPSMSDVDVLVATDLASRGVDAAGVGHVVQVRPSKDLAQWLHRLGRTARAGWSGSATTLVRSPAERQLAVDMERLARSGARDAVTASRDAMQKRRRVRVGRKRGH